MLLCKPKRKYLLTCEVSRYCRLTLLYSTPDQLALTYYIRIAGGGNRPSPHCFCIKLLGLSMIGGIMLL